MENSQTSKNQSNCSETEKKFIDALEVFMEQCYIFIESQKQPKLPRMSETQRLAKIKEVAGLIKEKELELSKLQAQRDALNSMSGQATPKSRSAQNVPCVKNCPAECSTDGV